MFFRPRLCFWLWLCYAFPEGLPVHVDVHVYVSMYMFPCTSRTSTATLALTARDTAPCPGSRVRNTGNQEAGRTRPGFGETSGEGITREAVVTVVISMRRLTGQLDCWAPLLKTPPNWRRQSGLWRVELVLALFGAMANFHVDIERMVNL
jgi:hypothetical protein